MDLNRRSFMASAAAVAAAVASSSAQAQPAAKKYRACIIGDTKQGGYGHSMHLAFALRPDVEVVALADPDEAGRTKYAAEAGAARTYADYREMLDKEKPNLVAVGPRCTVRHKEYLLACAAIAAHGYMEKPLSVDLAEADAMVAAIEAQKLKWSIAYNVRATPVLAHVKKAVMEDRILGSVLEVRSRGKEDDRAGAEDMIVLGTHVFDLMVYLLGKPTSCSAEITWNGKPATPADVREATEPLGPIVGNRIHAMYGFEGGIAGHFSSMKTRDGAGGRWGLDIYGTRGILTIRMEVVPQVFWLDDPTWAPGGRNAAWQPLPGMPAFAVQDQARERHKIIVDDLIAAIEGNREPQVSLKDGRNALEMVQAVFESYTTGRRAPIPAKDRTHPLNRWA